MTENTDTLRTMPESLSAEAAVLCAMLIKPDCIADVVDILVTDSFYRCEHRTIFSSVCKMYDENGPSGIDAVTLRDSLVKLDALEDVGGVEYIAKVLDSLPSAANVIYYANIVQDKYLLRIMIDIAGDILNRAYSQADEPRELLDEAEQQIFKVSESEVKTDAEFIGATATERCEAVISGEYLDMRGMSTGYVELDDMTCGLQNGELIIIAGRPSMGKSTLALNMLSKYGIEDGLPVALYSLEMSRQQLSERMLIMHAGIDGNRFRKAMLDEKEKDSLLGARDVLVGSRILVDDSSSLDPLALRSKARKLKSRYDIKCIFVDYMQLMHVRSKKVDSRQQEITLISRYLKCLARELDIPVVVLSQLNRVPEQRVNHMPRMSDLRESGSIEQDADVIILLHREDYYHRNQPDYEPNGITSVIVAKQRCGPTGAIKLLFDEGHAKFMTLSKIEETEYERPF